MGFNSGFKGLKRYTIVNILPEVGHKINKEVYLLIFCFLFMLLGI